MGDKSLFREAADSITKWMEDDARQKHERIIINGGSLNESARDIVRDLKEGVSALWNTMGTDRKFLHEYNLRSGRFEQSWKENISQKIGYENFGFRMASGWELPKGVPFNGKIDPEKEGKKIDGLTAVFFRGKGGKLEVLDYRDSRYEDLVAPYLITQLIVPSMAGKAFGALSLIAKGTKAAEIVSATANAAGKTWAAADNVSGLYLAGTQVSSTFMLKPDAIRRLAHLLDNPQAMNQGKLREEINTAFQEFSYRDGPLSEQYHVPALALNENPLARLQDLGKGVLQNIYKVASPFEKVGQQHFKKEEQITEVRDEIAKDMYFQRGYLKLASKALSGAKLSEQENTLLVFGTNVATQLMYDKVSPERLPKILGELFAVPRVESMTDENYSKTVKGSIDQRFKDTNERIVKQEAFEKQEAMAKSMAFSMH